MTIPAGWWVVGMGVLPVARTLDGPALPVVVLRARVRRRARPALGWRAARDGSVTTWSLHDDGYLRFLRERDGEPDFSRHTLARREEFFAALARGAGALGGAASTRRPTCRTSTAAARARASTPALLWLLATARGEPGGALRRRARGALRRASPPTSEPVRLHVTLQEIYHTRILADVVAHLRLARVAAGRRTSPPARSRT